MKLFFTLVMVSSFFAAGGAAGEETAAGGAGIAWIDLPRVLKDYRRAEELVAEFEREKAAREAEVQKLVDEIERLEGEMLLLSDQARAARTEEIMRKKLSVNRMIEEAEAALARRSMIRQGELLEEVSAAAEKVALREGYDFVLRGEVLLFKDPDREITDLVIAELNREGEESGRE